MAYKGQVDFIIIKLENLPTHQSYNEQQQQLEVCDQEKSGTREAAEPSHRSAFCTAISTCDELRT
jgi:hypothetical protein